MVGTWRVGVARHPVVVLGQLSAAGSIRSGTGWPRGRGRHYSGRDRRRDPPLRPVRRRPRGELGGDLRTGHRRATGGVHRYRLLVGVSVGGSSAFAAAAATAICAAALMPLKTRVQRRVDRLLYPLRQRTLAAIADLRDRTHVGLAQPEELQPVLRAALGRARPDRRIPDTGTDRPRRRARLDASNRPPAAVRRSSWAESRSECCPVLLGRPPSSSPRWPPRRRCWSRSSGCGSWC